MSVEMSGLQIREPLVMVRHAGIDEDDLRALQSGRDGLISISFRVNPAMEKQTAEGEEGDEFHDSHSTFSALSC